MADVSPAKPEKKPVWVGAFDIPKVIRLPGLVIRVRIVDPVERVMENDALWLYNAEQQTAVILIDGQLPIEVQRYSLIHELQHALVDLLDVMVEHYRADVQPKRVNADQRAATPGSSASRSPDSASTTLV